MSEPEEGAAVNGEFDPGDMTQLNRLTHVAIQQVRRAAGSGGYAPMPAGGSEAYEDLAQELQLAALEAVASYVPGAKTKWQTALDAAVNAGRRFLYGADREVPESQLAGAAEVGEDEQNSTSPLDVAKRQLWEDSDADPDRPYEPESDPPLPPEWGMLRSWASAGIVEGVDRTIVENWGMSAQRLASVTGLTEETVRQRKHRMVIRVREQVAEIRKKYT